MATQNLKVKSGNNHIVFMDGNPVGLAQSLDMHDDYSPEAASGIGDIHAVEYVPTMARHTLNLEQLSLSKDSLRALGITAENGDDVLKGRVFDILAVDKNTGAALRKYIGCSYASGGVSIRKHAIVVNNAVFNALDVSGTGA
jgi:hypothetical protein